MLTGKTKMKFIDRLKYKDKIGIYKIVNKINGKVYIGQTGENFQRRYLFHNWKLCNNIHDNQHLQKSWNKYGKDNFQFEIVEELKDSSMLNDREIYWIKYYRENGNCYNIQDGGQPKCLHHYISAESRKHVGEINRQRMLGTKLSEETKHKMSESRKGKRVYRHNDLLSDEQARQIKQMLVDGYSTYEIRIQLDIPYKAVNGILSSNTYSSIKVDGWNEFRQNRKMSKGKPIGNRHALRHNQKTDEEIVKIRQLYNKYQNISAVAKELNIGRGTVKKYIS